MTETRNVYNENGEVVGTLTLPADTPEERWARVTIVYNNRPQPVPQSIPAWRLKFILIVAGLKDTVDAVINNLPEPDKTFATLAWNEGATVDRHSPLVLAIGEAASISEQQIDTLFTNAFNLQV